MTYFFYNRIITQMLKDLLTLKWLRELGSFNKRWWVYENVCFPSRIQVLFIEFFNSEVQVIKLITLINNNHNNIMPTHLLH